MVNIYTFVKQGKNKKVPEPFRRELGKDMKRLRRNYPFFLYDEHRLGGAFYNALILSEDIRNQLGYINTPLFKSLDDNRYAIHEDGLLLNQLSEEVGDKTIIMTEGDIIWFKNSVKTAYYFDCYYKDYYRRLVSIPFMNHLENNKLEFVTAWIYFKKIHNHNFNFVFIEDGDIHTYKSTEKNEKTKIINDIQEWTIKQKEESILNMALLMRGTNDTYISDVTDMTGIRESPEIIVKNLAKRNIVKITSPGVFKVINNEWIKKLGFDNLIT